MENFIFGIVAISKDLGLFFSSVFGNTGVMSFFAGFFVAILMTGFVLTKNPRHIPIILRNTSYESFRRLAPRDKKGTYKVAYSDFVKTYNRIRAVSFVAIACFAIMVIFIAVMFGRS